jgi:hypothetical protein
VYLRHSTVRKNGKKHVYWRLVRSVRRNGKVVQETVAQLGELDAQGRAKAKALARQITGRGDQRELFEEVDSSLPERLRDFLHSPEPWGVFLDLKRSLILRWRAIDDLEFNLGYVKTNGDLWTDAVNWKTGEYGLLETSHTYINALAQMIGGEILMRGGRDPYVARDKRPPKVDELLDHADAWRDAIERYIRELTAGLAHGHGATTQAP